MNSPFHKTVTARAAFRLVFRRACVTRTSVLASQESVVFRDTCRGRNDGRPVRGGGDARRDDTEFNVNQLRLLAGSASLRLDLSHLTRGYFLPLRRSAQYFRILSAAAFRASNDIR